MADAGMAVIQAMLERVLEGQRRHDQEFNEIKLRLEAIERAMVQGRRPETGNP